MVSSLRTYKVKKFEGVDISYTRSSPPNLLISLLRSLMFSLKSFGDVVSLVNLLTVKPHLFPEISFPLKQVT